MARGYRLNQTGAEVQQDLNTIEDIELATQEKEGLMSAEDKIKLDGIESGAEKNTPNTVVDPAYVHSDNNFSDADKEKLDGIESGAEANVVETIRVNGVPAPMDGKAANVTVPTRLSQMLNDSAFVSYTTAALVNYYLKSETYSKAEVQALIAAIQGISVRSVNVLPEASAATKNIIFLVPSSDPQTSNVKDEFITIDVEGGGYGWEQIGSTAIDLSGYVTDAELTTALASYTTTADLTTLLSAKYEKPSDGIPSSDMSEAVQTSLGKADSALQSFTETDPTVPSWAKAQNPPTEIFWATYGTTTAAEVDAAISAGKAVMCNYQSDLYQYSGKDAYYIYFYRLFSEVQYGRLVIRLSDGVWSNGNLGLQLVSSRVQTIIGKESSTTYYPSTKAVADYVAGNKQVFVGEYGVTTASEVDAAITANKEIVVKNTINGVCYGLVKVESGRYVFSSPDYLGYVYMYILNRSTDSWSYSTTALQAKNLVTSFQSTPDNTHYPAEKLVKDSLDAKQPIIDASHKLDYGLLSNTPTIPDAVEPNPTVPAGTTPTSLTGLKIGSGYYDIDAGGGTVTDVTVGGTSVVSDGVAVIPAIPTVEALTSNEIDTLWTNN